MAEHSCIVCLGDLRDSLLATLDDNEPAGIPGDDGVQLRDTKLSTKRYQYHLLMLQSAQDRSCT